VPGEGGAGQALPDGRKAPRHNAEDQREAAAPRWPWSCINPTRQCGKVTSREGLEARRGGLARGQARDNGSRGGKVARNGHRDSSAANGSVSGILLDLDM
jgi:hypothetical protein